MGNCQHTDVYYYPETNEAGWRCTCGFKPGEPPGFSQAHDRERLEFKVDSILQALHNADLVYVSNSDMGDYLIVNVAKQCRKLGLFDQYTIAKLLLDELQGRHAKYWREVSDGIIAGSDPRGRCECGALSTSSVGSRDGWRNYCSAHVPGMGES